VDGRPSPTTTGLGVFLPILTPMGTSPVIDTGERPDAACDLEH
jgi:hypothetical protein